jgi:hypothetical protein
MTMSPWRWLDGVRGELVTGAYIDPNADKLTLEPLEVIPHRFLYHYECFEPDCPGHHQGIIDWEIHQAYRKWRREYLTDFIERVRRKWFGELCGPTRDTRFFVGNMHQHPQSFLVLGVFWPARPGRPKAPGSRLAPGP